MRVAITDACIFIDLCELRLITHLFGLQLEIHTSVDVFNEMYPQQQEVLKAFRSVGRLTVHNIVETEREAIQVAGYPNSLSNSDKTVLYLAAKLNALVLSSDKAVRHHAKTRAIEYHGMLWIFDKLVEASLVSQQEASDKLKILITTNILYQNSAVLLAEVNNRLKKWQAIQIKA